MSSILLIIISLTVLCSCGQENGVSDIHGDIVSCESRLPKIMSIDLEEVSGSGDVIIGEASDERREGEIYRCVYNDIAFEFILFSLPPGDGDIHTWNKAFSIAEKGCKLLTPAVFSNSDDLFIRCRHLNFVSYLLQNGETAELRGVVGSADNSSFIVYFSCVKDSPVDSVESIFEGVILFYKGLNE